MSDIKRVLTLRPEGQRDEIVSLLADRGFEAIAIPAIQILPIQDPAPLDACIERMSDYDLVVFTSANGVDAFIERARLVGREPAEIPAGAIGPGTAAALEREGMQVGWLPSRFTTEALAEELPLQYRSVLLVRADIATSELEERLAERGFVATRVDAYQTSPVNADAIRSAVGQGVDAVLVTSASVARSLAQAISGMAPPPIISIGPATTKACLALGLPVSSEAIEHTLGGLMRCLEEYLRD